MKNTTWINYTITFITVQKEVMAKKQPETIYGEKFDKDLEKIFGSNIWLENIQQKTKNGTPDRLACIFGDFWAFELKVEGGTSAMLQLIKLTEIRKAGGRGLIVYPHTHKIVLDHLKKVYENELYKT